MKISTLLRFGLLLATLPAPACVEPNVAADPTPDLDAVLDDEPVEAPLALVPIRKVEGLLPGDGRVVTLATLDERPDLLLTMRSRAFSSGPARPPIDFRYAAGDEIVAYGLPGHSTASVQVLAAGRQDGRWDVRAAFLDENEVGIEVGIEVVAVRLSAPGSRP